MLQGDIDTWMWLIIYSFHSIMVIESVNLYCLYFLWNAYYYEYYELCPVIFIYAARTSNRVPS
jgi:hypothetical protein